MNDERRFKVALTMVLVGASMILTAALCWLATCHMPFMAKVAVFGVILMITGIITGVGSDY